MNKNRFCSIFIDWKCPIIIRDDSFLNGFSTFHNTDDWFFHKIDFCKFSFFFFFSKIDFLFFIKSIWFFVKLIFNFFHKIDFLKNHYLTGLLFGSAAKFNWSVVYCFEKSSENSKLRNLLQSVSKHRLKICFTKSTNFDFRNKF